jgi:hypothetical protein
VFSAHVRAMPRPTFGRRLPDTPSCTRHRSRPPQTPASSDHNAVFRVPAPARLKLESTPPRSSPRLKNP